MNVIGTFTALLVCFVLIGQIQPQEVSRKILNFQTNFNGVWSNKNQSASQSGHDFIQVRLIPVKVPALGDAPVTFVEQVVNGFLNMLLLVVATEENDNIILTPHNFTDQSQYEPLTYNISDLSKLTTEDIQSTEACRGVYVPVDTTFTGFYTTCKTIVNGKRPTFAITFGCNRMVATIPAGVLESEASTPYVFSREQDRFPLPGAPQDYISPCDKKDE